VPAISRKLAPTGTTGLFSKSPFKPTTLPAPVVYGAHWFPVPAPIYHSVPDTCCQLAYSPGDYETSIDITRPPPLNFDFLNHDRDGVSVKDYSVEV